MRSQNRLKWICAAALTALLLLCAAQAQPAVTVEAEMGYENTVAFISAMPLRVRLKNEGSDAELTVAVNLTRSMYEYDRCEYPVALAGGAEMNLTLPVNITFKQAAYTVEVLAGGDVIASAEVKPQKTLAPDTLLVGLLCDQPQALRYLNVNSANDTLMRGETWQTLALSRETFPESAELLRAFRILAIDGFDISTLSVSQQSALRQWLRGGGTVIVGGGASAAVSGKAFSTLTGITALTPAPAQRVDSALLSALEGGSFSFTAKDRVNGAVMLSELNGAANPVAALNGKTLIDRCPVDAGAVYTCAFSLSERPLSAWSGLSGYWQRLLLTVDQARYQRTVSDLQNYYNWNQNQYVDTWLLRQLPVDNPDNVLLAVLVIVAMILLTGIGSYLILKKLDRREWMWLTVPALSLIGAALTVAISGSMRLNKPVAAAYAVMQVDEKGTASMTIRAGIAGAGREPLRLSASGSTLSPGGDNYGYYIDDDEQAEKAQPRLRYTYTYGEGMTLTLPQAAAWDVRALTITPDQTPACPVAAAIWWEEDGLHGEIVNGSDLTMQPGYVVTSLGYCRVPELLPGQKHAFSIVSNPDRQPDPDNGEAVYEGEIVSGSYVSVYTILDAAIWPESHGNGRADQDPDLVRTRNLIEACRNNWGEFNVFRYVTFSDEIAPPALTLNGAPVERTAFEAAIDVKFSYRAVGESGIVKLTRGMIPAYAGTANAGQAPVSTGDALQDYAYFDLRSDPVICFALGEVAGLDLDAIDLEKAAFTCESYGATPRVQLYNASTGRWQELSFSSFPVNIDGETLKNCLDGEGRLFVRLGGGSAHGGSEIYNPALTLEGRVK